MRTRVVGPIVLTTLLLVVVLMKQIVQDISKGNGIVNARRPRQ